MSIKSSVCAVVCSMIMLIGVVSPVFSGESASPEEVYEKVNMAATVLENLGQEGLEAFMDPKGEFVWKDTYVWVLDCQHWTNAAHPMNHKLVGMPLKDIQCKKTGKKFFQAFCEVSQKPYGGWIEYWWPKPGKPADQLFRKIAFVIQVPNQPYQVASGIYNEAVSLEELNKTLQ